MRSAPNHTAATLERLMVSSTAGNITAIIRPVFSDVSVRSALALPKRTASSGSRTKARTTRMPLICSRSTWFTRSMRFCILVNCGCMRIATWPTLSSRIGMATRRISESGPSSRMAKNTPPMIMIGAVTNRVQRHQDEDLHLGDVVGDPRDQRRGAELADLARRVPHHGVEQVAADVAPEAHRRAGAVERRRDREQTWTKVTASMTAPTFQM